MKVIDRELQRQEEANTSAGKKRKNLKLLFQAGAVVLFICYLFYMRLNPEDRGTPFLYTIDGTEITPGKTRVQDLLDAGYNFGTKNLKDMNGYGAIDEIDLTTELEKETKYTDIILEKGGKEIASVYVGNFTSKSIAFPDGIITFVAVYTRFADNSDAVINGIHFKDITVDNCTQYFPDAKKDGDKYSLNNKDYFLSIYIDQGAVHGISSSYIKMN